MSLPSQNCSTELHIKYCRRHAHLSSSTDHHDNDGLSTQEQKKLQTFRVCHRQNVQAIPGKSVKWSERPQAGIHNNHATSKLYLISHDVKARRKSNR
jgi:hypothetical protein